MNQPKVTEEVTYSTIETSSKTTSTNKRILRNTWKGNAVQVDSYDSEGRLQSSETDKHTYQDTDTEVYKWTDRDEPPAIPPPDYDKQVEPFGENRLHTSTEMASNGSVLMVKSTEVSSTPVVHWTGHNTIEHVKESGDKGHAIQHATNHVGDLYLTGPGHPNIPPEVYSTDNPLGHGDEVLSQTVYAGPATQHTEVKIKEDMDGSKWSRTEETVWMSTNQRINPNLAIGYGADGSSKDSRVVIQKDGPVENGGLSIEERKRMRREASRALTAGATK